jgi:hypothetical protein
MFCCQLYLEPTFLEKCIGSLEFGMERSSRLCLRSYDFPGVAEGCSENRSDIPVKQIREAVS